MNALQNVAKYKRYLMHGEGLLVVRGSVEPVISGMRVYNSRYEIAPPSTILEPVVCDLLSAAALSALSLSDRESWGWSLTFKGMQAGFFVGLEPEGMMCLRVLPAESDKGSVLVQRQKAGFPMTQSHLEPRSESAFSVAEQYFSEVVQTATRLATGTDGEGMLVQALPGGTFETVRDLGPEGLFNLVDGAIEAGTAKAAGEVLLFYECRCSEEMISGLIGKMKAADREDLFGELPHINVECPRCGREYTVTRTERTIH
jgi:hypothetical protein